MESKTLNPAWWPCRRLEEVVSNWALVRASPFLPVTSQGIVTLGPVSRNARKLFGIAIKAIFINLYPKSSEVYTPETSCLKRTFSHIKNMWIKQHCINDNVWDSAAAFRVRKPAFREHRETGPKLNYMLVIVITKAAPGPKLNYIYKKLAMFVTRWCKRVTKRPPHKDRIVCSGCLFVRLVTPLLFSVQSWLNIKSLFVEMVICYIDQRITWKLLTIKG